MTRKKTKRAGMKRRPILPKLDISTDQPIFGLPPPVSDMQKYTREKMLRKNQRDNRFRNTDKTRMRGSLLELKMAPLRSMLYGVKGNLDDSTINLLPQKIKHSKKYNTVRREYERELKKKRVKAAKRKRSRKNKKRKKYLTRKN